MLIQEAILSRQLHGHNYTPVAGFSPSNVGDWLWLLLGSCAIAQTDVVPPVKCCPGLPATTSSSYDLFGNCWMGVRTALDAHLSQLLLVDGYAMLLTRLTSQLECSCQLSLRLVLEVVLSSLCPGSLSSVSSSTPPDPGHRLVPLLEGTLGLEWRVALYRCL